MSSRQFRPRSESFGLAAGGFCSVEVVLGEAGLIAMRSSEGKDSPSLDMTELTAGFCNVVNMVRVDGDRTVVVKTFGDLARARIIAGGSLCFPVERAAADGASRSSRPYALSLSLLSLLSLSPLSLSPPTPLLQLQSLQRCSIRRTTAASTRSLGRSGRPSPRLQSLRR